MAIKLNFQKKGAMTIAALLCAAVSQCAGLIASVRPGFDPTLLGATFGVRLDDSIPNSTFHYYYVADIEQIHVIQAAMAAHPGIEWVEDDKDILAPESTNGKGGSIPQLRKVPISVQYTSGGHYGQNLNWVSKIGWTIPEDVYSRPVRVAVLDTGLSPHQPLLWANVVASMTAIPREVNAWDIRSGRPGTRSYDPNGALGHGTMVTSLIAMLAPEAELVVCRVADSAGYSSAWKVIKGIVFAVNQDCELANISLGSLDQLPAVGEILDWADTQGLQVIAAIGNDSLEEAIYPSRYSKAIAISGVDPDDKKASFSNWHGTADMSAPATGIVGADWNGRMMTWHGTSFAAPIVTGCVAQSLRLRTRLSPDNLRNRIEGVGVNIDPLNPLYENKLGPRVSFPLLEQAILNP